MSSSAGTVLTVVVESATIAKSSTDVLHDVYVSMVTAIACVVFALSRASAPSPSAASERHDRRPFFDSSESETQ